MRRTLDLRRLFVTFAARGSLAAMVVACVAVYAVVPARATPALTMDVASGEVLYQQDATQPWYPASTTKLMTVYVALSAVRDGRIAMNTPLVVSARAHHMPPSKMGFPVGTQVTLDNALKMLMVRSANDIAITVAEGIAGSVEAFADDMNRAGSQIGLRESHFVNPNGLPDADHYSSARDMALIARALYTQFPQYASLFDIGALSMGSETIVNHNNLLGRYAGIDGMKTGFTCAAGFNIVASAYRDGRRLVVVVFGAPSVAVRSQKVVALFDRGFAGIDRPVDSIVALPTSGTGTPPDMHNQVCRNRAPLINQFETEVTQLDAPLTGPPPGASTLGLSALSPERAMLFATQSASTSVPTALMINSMPTPVFDPVPVHIGADPGYAGVVAEARAPHSEIGSEPQPAAVEAYAATPPAEPTQIGNTPLAVDANALPLKGRRGHFARTAHRGRGTMKAAAEAPKTKVIAGADEDGKSDAATKKASIGDSDESAAKSPVKPGRAKLATNPKRDVAKRDVAKRDVAKHLQPKHLQPKHLPPRHEAKTPAKAATKVSKLPPKAKAEKSAS